MVCLFGLGPTPRRKAGSSYNLHLFPQPPHSLFTGFPQQELPPVESSVETYLHAGGSFRAPPPRAASYALLTRERPGSVDRVTTALLFPGAPSAIAGLEALEALLLELEASFQSADRCAGPRTHGDMPQAHRLRPSICRFRLPRHRAHDHQISRTLLTP